jgi:hypothetical protein
MRSPFAAAVLAAALAAQEPAVAVGSTVGNFTLTDRHWLPRKLEDTGPARAWVLWFTTTDCPMVQRVLPRVAALERELRPRGVRFLAVNVGAADSIVDACAQSVAYGLDFPATKDRDGPRSRRSASRAPPPRS